MGIALAIGVAIIAIKEMLNRKVLFRHEIEKLTSLPIVSEIFQEDGKKPIVVEEGKRSQTAEQFRKLRTAFTFMGLDSKRKKVLVTSSISGEGKSFIATNLALSVALTNKKVVLVEADLINPSLSRDLNINNELGLSDYLKGRNEAEEIIKSTPFSSNLFIIPSGPLPNNPSELIVNGKIEELFYYLGTIFDCIIVDAPPVIPVSDAYVLSDHCDATLFVIRHKYTPKIFVQRIDDSNKVNQLKNAAIVFNGIQPRGFNKNYYGYGYGYGYIFKGDDVGKKRKVST
jgi:capsular exopolysaccharide synthesis family protein